MSLVQSLGKFMQRDPAEADAAPSRTDLGIDSERDSAITSAFEAEGVESVQGDPRAQSSAQGVQTDDDQVVLPLLGRASLAVHQRRLLTLLAIGVVVLALLAGWMLQRSRSSGAQLTAVGQALMQSQRLAKAFEGAVLGQPKAFDELADSATVFTRNVQALMGGDDALGVKALGESFRSELEDIRPLMERAERFASTMQTRRKNLEQAAQAIAIINNDSADWLRATESALRPPQSGVAAAEIVAAGRLGLLTQRIARLSNDVFSGAGASTQAQLDQDLADFKTIAQGLPEATSGAQGRAMMALYEKTRAQATWLLDHPQDLSDARLWQRLIVADSEPLGQHLQALQTKLTARSGFGPGELALLAVVALFVLLCGAGISRTQLADSRRRQAAAEAQQEDARLQEQEAKRINDANQAAILRLMNELQSVAEGDLTQEATVTEDITGAIADSVNYTVEELRALVGSVQNTATRVAQTTTAVDSTSTELLATSSEQLREIRETGQSVLDMATRINGVSHQAQESATVARQSLKAADSGLKAVQNAIGGMNAIRDQIQDTSKRIKRLGESSQEIGEITELISDITEQTNLLALNAAIQAASAGEAGRGFSVVAEEVQRLAERSADATRQIAALVKAIQVDTQDAVAAMERSTHGVVEGARLSDSAGTALSEIDTVSRELAELIESISSSASREAELANGVAENIQHIFAVTEQTGESTRNTAHQVRELSQMAEELRTSVARFKIA